MKCVGPFKGQLIGNDLVSNLLVETKSRHQLNDQMLTLQVFEWKRSSFMRTGYARTGLASTEW